MTGNVFYEQTKKLLKNLFDNLTVEAKRISATKRVYPDEYCEKFLTYGKALEDVLFTFCGNGCTTEFMCYKSELGEVLFRDVKRLQREYDLKEARSELEKLTKKYGGLSELLGVISDDDLLQLGEHCRDAWSTFIDNIEFFEDKIFKLRKKYKLKQEKE